MPHTTGLQVGLVFGLVILAGCGPEKELPTTVTLTPDRDLPTLIAVPPQSNPAAAKIVDRCLAASTEGHPERIGKAKAFRLAMKGVVIRQGVEVATIRRVDAVWPDRFVQFDEFNEGGPVRVIMGLRRPVLWARNHRDGQSTKIPVPESEQYEAVIAAEAVGRYWMALLVPLTDPKTIVFDPKTETVDGQAVSVIKASVPGCPVFTLWFDDKTGFLGRIDFMQTEQLGSNPIAKTFILKDHRLFSGLMIPGKIGYRHNGPVVESWAVDSWDFVDKIDDIVFDAPK
jgi:hypothetical protein